MVSLHRWTLCWSSTSSLAFEVVGSGEGESIVSGSFSGPSTGDLGSGQGIVLSSDWAPGLENMLIQSEGEDSEDESEVSVVDVALMSTQDETTMLR